MIITMQNIMYRAALLVVFILAVLNVSKSSNLPPNWTAHVWNGREYYYNTETGESQWTVPVLGTNPSSAEYVKPQQQQQQQQQPVAFQRPRKRSPPAAVINDLEREWSPGGTSTGSTVTRSDPSDMDVNNRFSPSAATSELRRAADGDEIPALPAHSASENTESQDYMHEEMHYSSSFSEEMEVNGHRVIKSSSVEEDLITESLPVRNSSHTIQPSFGRVSLEMLPKEDAFNITAPLLLNQFVLLDRLNDTRREVDDLNEELEQTLEEVRILHEHLEMRQEELEELQGSALRSALIEQDFNLQVENLTKAVANATNLLDNALSRNVALNSSLWKTKEECAAGKQLITELRGNTTLVLAQLNLVEARSENLQIDLNNTLSDLKLLEEELDYLKTGNATAEFLSDRIHRVGPFSRGLRRRRTGGGKGTAAGGAGGGRAGVIASGRRRRGGGIGIGRSNAPFSSPSTADHDADKGSTEHKTAAGAATVSSTDPIVSAAGGAERQGVVDPGAGAAESSSRKKKDKKDGQAHVNDQVSEGEEEMEERDESESELENESNRLSAYGLLRQLLEFLGILSPSTSADIKIKEPHPISGSSSAASAEEGVLRSASLSVDTATDSSVQIGYGEKPHSENSGVRVDDDVSLPTSMVSALRANLTALTVSLENRDEEIASLVQQMDEYGLETERRKLAYLSLKDTVESISEDNRRLLDAEQNRERKVAELVASNEALQSERNTLSHALQSANETRLQLEMHFQRECASYLQEINSTKLALTESQELCVLREREILALQAALDAERAQSDAVSESLRNVTAQLDEQLRIAAAATASSSAAAGFGARRFSLPLGSFGFSPRAKKSGGISESTGSRGGVSPSDGVAAMATCEPAGDGIDRPSLPFVRRCVSSVHSCGRAAVGWFREKFAVIMRFFGCNR